MARIGAIGICILLFASAVFAQGGSNNEVFGGYQFTRFNRIDSFAAYHEVLNGNGFDAAISHDLTGWMGIKGDFGVTFANDQVSQANGAVDVETYTVGPVFASHATSALTPFAEVLVGGYRELPRVGGTVTGGAVIAGGGLDARYDDRVSIRVFQLDWVRYLSASCQGFCGTGRNNLRFSAGVVVHF